MRPRNEREREVDRLSKQLPYITNAQFRWVRDSVIDWHINCTGKKCWCEKCGQPFDAKLEDDGKAVCPHCGAELIVKKNRKRKLRGYEYIQIITVCHGWQVIRYFLVRWEGCVREKPQVYFQEVIQKWCQPGRPTITRGTSLVMLPYWAEIPYSGAGCLSIKNPSYFYTEWMRLKIYPTIRLLNPYRKTVRKAANFSVICAEDILAVIYSVPYFERLYKEGEMDELKEAMKYHSDFQRYWPSVKVVLRHGFKPEHWRDYFDYLKMLAYVRKDMRNPYYVAPSDWEAMHTRILYLYQRKKDEAERRRREREAIREVEAEERRIREEERMVRSFEERIGHFRSLLIAAGGIEIRPLMTIREFAEEGKAMRHCVFALGYYKRPDSLILSARDKDGKRIETIEVGLKAGVVIQSRGACNTTTDRHDEILAMVNSHMREIQRMEAS